MGGAYGKHAATERSSRVDTILASIQDGLTSNFGLDTRNLEYGSSWFQSVPSDKCWDNTSSLITKVPSTPFSIY
jgi:hypothetical protein